MAVVDSWVCRGRGLGTWTPGYWERREYLGANILSRTQRSDYGREIRAERNIGSLGTQPEDITTYKIRAKRPFDSMTKVPSPKL